MWDKATEHLSKDRYLGKIVITVGACTISPSMPSRFFTDLVDSIVSQQLSTKAASTIFARLIEQSPGKLLTPEFISGFGLEDLRSIGISNQKAKYIHDLTEKIIRKEIILEDLANLTDEQVVEKLLSVKGIGTWTAQMFLMFSLARPDVFPIKDLGIRNALCKITGKPKEDQFDWERFSNPWSPYRTAASWYLWKSLEL
jgi:DNA-3-methyladenine glycosylase II